VFRAAGVGAGSHVVVYGAPLLAARAFYTLEYLGHPRVALLDGGLPAWLASGGDVATGPPATPAPGDFRAAVDGHRLVDAEWVAARLDDPTITLVDARPLPQFTGEVGGDGIPRPGHIPGARHLFWEDLLDGAEPPLLRDEATLRARFRNAGIPATGSIVAYCRTGIQASYLYFVARYLGYDVTMYDGSFSDWSPRLELPFARR
jgi:thiosulfate/3-mercaptopyruvate sulfurtransferase